MSTEHSSDDGAFWERLGSGRSTPNVITSPPAYAATSEYGGHKLSATINKPFERINASSKNTRATRTSLGEEDLLSGFGSAVNEGHGSYPKVKASSSSSVGSSEANAGDTREKDSGYYPETELDDDPFGLVTGNGKMAAQKGAAANDAPDDDDVLGLLGRPVSEFQQKPKPERRPQNSTETSHPQHHAMAELLEMGFSAAKAREALESTESGTDVQAAVGWLLNQAHQTSKKQSHTSSNDRGISEPRKERRRSSGSRTKSTAPAWMRQNGSSQDEHRQNSRSPANGDSNPSKIASELGNNLFKTANSLWKTGTKKLNQAVAELNSDSDTSQPKWMREAKLEADGHKAKSQRRESEAHDLDSRAVKAMQEAAAKQKEADVTEEALMLESGDTRQARKLPSRSKPEVSDVNRHSSETQSPMPDDRPRPPDVRQARFVQQAPKASSDPRSRLNKQAIEEQASEAYISPARRKKATLNPTTKHRPPSPEPDLLFGASQSSQPQPPTHRAPSAPQRNSRATTTQSLPTRPPPPKRTVPPLSPSALQASTQARLAGTAAFKRGDYAEATTHYTNALSALPPTHPLTLPLLTNRALSHSKTGDPKASIADATTAIDLIGPSHGVSEGIDLGDEGLRDMFLFWVKAMTRKAEALEQIERWSDALIAWKLCVEAGVGGATSIAGRNRCEKAVNPPTLKSAAPRKPPPKPKPRSTALDDLAGRPAATSAQSAGAVSRLRAANLEAERVDDEKFALSDSVGERVQNWRAGKEGNLRALLASLETVLWEGAGWKKIGMGELILPGKVKVQYMKGIAKVHPDKVSAAAFPNREMGV